MNDFNPEFDKEKLDIIDRYILGKLYLTASEASKSLNEFRFDIYSKKIYEFVWDDFCDWYIEGIKPEIYSENKQSNKIKVALYILDSILKLLHPVMPFITEEIYTHLTNKKNSLVEESYPEFSENPYIKDIEQFEVIRNIVREIRNMKNESNIKSSVKVKIYVDESKLDKVSSFYIEYFSLCEICSKTSVDINDFSQLIVDGIELFFNSDDYTDKEEEKNRLEKELQKLQAEIIRSEKMLSNKGFLDRAPKELIQKEKDKYAQYVESRKKLEETYNKIAN